MSKRARITLQPIPEAEPDNTTVTDSSVDPQPQLHVSSGAVAKPADTTASWIPSTRTLLKAVIAGVTVISLVMMWKNRNP